MGTFITLVVVVGLVGLAVRSMIKDKKSGKGSCGGNCGHHHQEVERMPQEQTKHEARNYHRTQMKRELIIQKLREQGCRITRQRRILLDIILEEECSCCKEIYYKALQKDSSIGPATVYRMVNTLESIGAISRKNFYKIACGEECFKDQGCTVELSDHTICRLSGEMWMDVMKSGLKAKGYIQNQDIENVIVSAVKIPSVFPVLMKIIIKKNCTYCLTEQVSAIL